MSDTPNKPAYIYVEMTMSAIAGDISSSIPPCQPRLCKPRVDAMSSPA